MTASSELYGGIAAAVVAVVIVAFIVGCASLIIPYGWPHTADDANATVLIGLMAALVTLPCAAVSALIDGVPLFRLLRRRGWVSVVQYLLGGLTMSALITAVSTLAHHLVGFVPNESVFNLALVIVAAGGPVAALTIRSVSQTRSSGLHRDEQN